MNEPGSNSPNSILSDQVSFILVEPQHSGNIGAAARAMKNMGLRQLVVVNPPAWDPETARWMAPGCGDVLAEMRIVATLDEALVGVQRTVASTARHRKQGHPVITPNTLARQVFDQGAKGVHTAILFGREDTGLSKADALRCESILRIPTPEHASLNMAQSVLLIRWQLFNEASERGAEFKGRTLGGSRGTTSTAKVSKGDARDELADLLQIEPAVNELVGLLDQVGYTRSTQPDKVRLTARQALQRASVAIRHIEALRGMVARIRWALDHPNVDWRAPRKR